MNEFIPGKKYRHTIFDSTFHDYLVTRIENDKVYAINLTDDNLECHMTYINSPFNEDIILLEDDIEPILITPSIRLRLL